MALGAKRHGLGKGNSASVGEPESVVVPGVVTAQAGQVAVLVLETLVELVEVGGVAGVGPGCRRGMAGTAGNSDRTALGIDFAGVDAGRIDGLPDRDGMARSNGRGGGRGRGRGCVGLLDGEDGQHARDRGHPGDPGRDGETGKARTMPEVRFPK